MTHDEFISALQELGISARSLQDLPPLPLDVEGLLVYGSQARGDAVPGSDVDILAMVAISRPSSHFGDVNVSYYTREQLSTGIGTLFGYHLRRDAKIVRDDHGDLKRALESMGEVDTDRLLGRVLRMSELFTNLERDLPKYLPGLLRQARYLLRSSLYAQAIADGDPCFSVREIAHRLCDPDLVYVLSSRPAGEATVEDLQGCLSRLRSIIGPFPMSQHGSLESTVVNLWEDPNDVLSMAFMALGIGDERLDYAEVEKILL